MEQNEPEIIDSTIDTETTENEVAEAQETESTDTETVTPELEDIDELKKKVATLEAQKEHWREKAEKAPKATSTKQSTDLNSKDLIALMNAKVAEDDIDEVVEYAKFKNISVAEALKTSVVKTSLREKAEQRRTAEATNTGPTRSGTAKVSEEVLLEKARKSGEIPENDADLDRLLEQRYK